MSTTDVYGPYKATVVAVHDGDTCTLDLDLGFQITFRYRCRLYGINAPELATVEGKAALEFALTLLHPGDRVTVLSHSWDKFGGRFDGTIGLADGRDFGAVMIDAGYAKIYFGTGPK
jgi:endonuclease YncB( thermonuclease family)